MTSTVDERLPTPKLDDRRFQALVDEAKRRIQQRCPEWTNHNVSPGRDADRGLRVDDRPAALPAEPCARAQLREVPRTARRQAATADRSARGRDLPALESSGQGSRNPRRHADLDTAHRRRHRQRRRRADHVRDLRPGPDRPVLVAVAREPRCVRRRARPRRPDASRMLQRPPAAGRRPPLGLDRAVPSCMVRLELPCRQGAGGGIAPDNPPLVWDARVGDDEGSVHLWNARTRELVRRFSGNRGHALHRIAFSPDGHMLASAGYGTIWVRDAHEIEQPGQRLEGHDSRVLALAFSADAATLVSAGDDGSIRLWNVHDAEQPPRTLGRGDRPAHGGPSSPSPSIVSGRCSRRRAPTGW